MSWAAVVSGCSLAMNSFAMSICVGACTVGSPWRPTSRLGLACGTFQFFMPLLGWKLGMASARWFSFWDHWLAFGLLAFVGGGMVCDFLRGGEEECRDVTRSLRLLLTVALATSIDALAVGAGFGLTRLPVMPLAAVAGGVTAGACAAGTWLGRTAGAGLGRKMELLGGVLLILIGLNILATHLMEEWRMGTASILPPSLG